MTHVLVCSGDCEPEEVSGAIEAARRGQAHLVTYPTHGPVEAHPLEEWERRQRGPLGRLKAAFAGVLGA